MNMRYMLCYAIKVSSPKLETEYFDSFADAVMKYTVLCSNCRDVVLADLEKETVIRHFSHRINGGNLSITNF